MFPKDRGRAPDLFELPSVWRLRMKAQLDRIAELEAQLEKRSRLVEVRRIACQMCPRAATSEVWRNGCLYTGRLCDECARENARKAAGDDHA